MLHVGTHGKILRICHMVISMQHALLRLGTVVIKLLHKTYTGKFIYVAMQMASTGVSKSISHVFSKINFTLMHIKFY